MFFIEASRLDQEWKSKSDEIFADMDRIMEEKGLQVYSILTEIANKRECIIYTKDKDVFSQFSAYLEGKPALKFTRIHSTFFNAKDRNCGIWENGNASYSRKKIEPEFRIFFETVYKKPSSQ